MVMENIADLSAKLRMPAISPEQLLEQQAAFDLIPYSEAARRACIALRDAEGAVSVVLGDPFDLDTQDWIEERLAAPFRYRLGSRADVAAYLAQQETGLRAMDGVARNAAENTYSGGAQEISFEAAAEADSTVVKLVSSTLYDALKAGASDVHLESTASGLTIKYRVDGVLTAAETHAGHRARRAGDLAHQGDVGARHRRAPRAAGRALQGAARRHATSTFASR